MRLCHITRLGDLTSVRIQFHFPSSVRHSDCYVCCELFYHDPPPHHLPSQAISQYKIVNLPSHRVLLLLTANLLLFSLSHFLYFVFFILIVSPHWQGIIHDEQTKLRARLSSITDDAKESISQIMNKKSPPSPAPNMTQLELLNSYYQLSIK